MARKSQRLPQVIHVDQDKCVNCHACIVACPVKTCNDGSGTHVSVDADTCIACGRCLTACTHGARYLTDDFPQFMEDAARHQPMIAFVAPSAATSFGDQYRRLNGWLTSLGVAAVFDVTLGAELCAMSYAAHIRGTAPRLLIAQPCAAIVTYIQVHRPELLPYLAPLDSPMLHAMKMVRRFFPQYRDHKIVAICPCPAKKREFDETGWGDYNVTYSSIRNYLEAGCVDLDRFPAEDFATPSPDTAVRFPVPGGLMHTLQRRLPGGSFRARTIQGQESVYSYLATLLQTTNATRDTATLVIDCLNCEHGCNCGPASLALDQGIDAVEQRIQRRQEELQTRNRQQVERGAPELTPMLQRYWDAGGYTRLYRDLSANNSVAVPGPAEREIILRSMHKYSEKDLFNCCSCGYGSCDDMAAAIHNGMNRPENCHHYLASETELAHRQLSQYRDHLENLVEERTTELLSTNERLRQEVADRLRAEDELEDSRQRLDNIVQGSPIATFVIDVNHRVVCWNRAIEKLSGIKAEQVVGTTEHWKAAYAEKRSSLADLLLDGDEEALACRYHGNCHRATILEDAYECVEFFPLLRKDGVWLHLTAALIRDSKRGVVGAMQTVQDITDRRRTEIQLEQSRQAAEAANRVKSEFLANMSHEIRTPMTAILGYASFLLAEEGVEKAPKHRVQAFDVIRRNGEHLLDLINGILDLSKIEAGKLQIERTPCRPRQLVADVVSLMHVRAEEKWLELACRFEDPMPEAIDTDMLRLRQVLMNLVGNAIKFSDRGRVDLVVRFLSGSTPPSMQFEVLDTGIGMTEEQIGQLFQPFNQVDNSASRRYGGTGLGLTICKRLVEALGGSISVRSVPGQGSAFSFTIAAPISAGDPASDAGRATSDAPMPSAPAPVSKPNGRLGRVLLAEDAPDIRRLMVLLLKSAGAEVEAVENGQLAVDRAWVATQEGRPFDVILMDMQMPVMDGYAATRQLRQRGYSRPIIALTAHAMVEDRQACLDAGCDDYLTKPIDVGQLAAKVANFATAASTGKAAIQCSGGPAPRSERETQLRSEYADHPIISGLLGEFVDSLGPRVQSLDAALDGGRPEELRQIAHQLKGAAGCYGYPSLADAAKMLEDAVRGGQLDSAPAAVEHITELTRAVVHGWNAVHGKTLPVGEVASES